MHAFEGEMLTEYSPVLLDRDGTGYVARSRGRLREDGLWEGWFEFDRGDGQPVRSERETTQPNRTDLVYWASGITAVYLEGAFRRATGLVATSVTV